MRRPSAGTRHSARQLEDLAAGADPPRPEPALLPGEALHAVSATGDLLANVGRALAEGLRALSPETP
jgi:hypothetical protein